MFIKTTISAGIQGFVDQHDNVRDLLKAIDEQFTTYDKSLANTLIMWFLSMKLTRIKEVCDHIIHIRNILAQWKALEVTMSDSSYTYICAPCLINVYFCWVKMMCCE